MSLAPVAVRLSELLGQEVKFAADPEVVGENAKAAVAAMNEMCIRDRFPIGTSVELTGKIRISFLLHFGKQPA